MEWMDETEWKGGMWAELGWGGLGWDGMVRCSRTWWDSTRWHRWVRRNDLRQRLPYRLLQRHPLLLTHIRDEVRDKLPYANSRSEQHNRASKACRAQAAAIESKWHLRVCVTDHRVAFALKFCPECLEVLDDSVVDDTQLAVKR